MKFSSYQMTIFIYTSKFHFLIMCPVTNSHQLQPLKLLTLYHLIELKAFIDDKLNEVQKMTSVGIRVEIVIKEEKKCC